VSEHLDPIKAIILGIIQGATEFLPISSTAHMRVVPALLHWADPGAAFSAVVQLGPIVAIIAFFRATLGAYAAGIGRSLKAGKLFPEGDKEAKLGWFTIFGTVPLIIAGLALESKVDKEYRNLYLVGGALILLGIILLIAERVSKRNQSLKDLTLSQAMGIGLAQALAIVPGASRSGCTITAGLFSGLTREDAADFSFLLSIPAITLAGLYKLFKVAKGGGFGGELGIYLLAAAVAAIVAYAVIKLFLGYLKDDRHTTGPFIAYRIALGIALILLAKFGVVTPDSLGTPEESKTSTTAVSNLSNSG
jgi:undecaprenyl-diphosphatase